MSVIRPDGTPRSIASRFCAEIAGAELALQKPSGMYCKHGLASMTVNDFDVARVALGENKTDAPARIHGHRPLPGALALQLVKSHASERAEVLQGFGDVQGQQQLHRKIEIESAKAVRPLPFPDPAALGIAPRPDHGKIVLRRMVQSKVSNALGYKHARCVNRSKITDCFAGTAAGAGRQRNKTHRDAVSPPTRKKEIGQDIHGCHNGTCPAHRNHDA